jgi:rhodanese-related sulfurtransferase
MSQLFEFIMHHWLLSAALIVAVLGLIIMEVRNQGMMSGSSSVNPTQAVQLLNQNKAVVLDIRSSQQFEQGHILGAINLSVTELNQSSGRLEKYKQRPLIVTCDTGGKSPAAATALRKRGFTQVYILSGGLQAWRNASMPLTKETRKIS